MLAPKRVLHRKSYGIQALEAHWITNRQIEACRVAMTRYMKRGGKVWITIFPDKPITKKPAETRMGSGKGNPEEWVAVVKPGRIMFEIPVRATPRSGWPLLSRAASCSRSTASPTRSLARPCVLPSTSCPSRPRSSPAPTRTGRNSQ